MMTIEENHRITCNDTDPIQQTSNFKVSYVSLIQN